MIHALIGTIVALTFSVLHDVGAVRVLTADSATTFTTTSNTSGGSEQSVTLSTFVASATAPIQSATRLVTQIIPAVSSTETKSPESGASSGSVTPSMDTSGSSSSGSGGTGSSGKTTISTISNGSSSGSSGSSGSPAPEIQAVVSQATNTSAALATAISSNPIPVPPNAVSTRTLQTVPSTAVTPTQSETRAVSPYISTTAPERSDDASLHQAIQLAELNTSTRVLDHATEKVGQSVREALKEVAPPATPDSVEKKVEAVTQQVRATLVERERPSVPPSAPAPESARSETVLAPQDVQAVARAVDTQVTSLSQAHDELVQRDGLALYTDTDKDGVSDYDEAHIYHTDPNNPYTAGGALTDGEKILRGIDPLSVASTPVPVQSPISEGFVVNDLFEVDSITATTAPAVAPAAMASSSAPVATSTQRAIAFSGRALPNSFVTLYIFSTPIVVTVKTDSDGRWQYRLDKELPDGKHELYVAMVDNSGSIIAKSPAVPFTKQAEALEYTPLVLPPVNDADARQLLMIRLAMVGGAAAVGLALVVVVGIGMVRAPRTPAV
jgi:hypothetical protein